MTLRGEILKTGRKACYNAILSTTHFTWNGPRSNQGILEEKSATNGLNHGTVLRVRM